MITCSMNWEAIGSLMGDIGEATSILISAEIELSIISIIVSCVDTILKNRRWGQHTKAQSIWKSDLEVSILSKSPKTDVNTKDDILKKSN